MFCARVSLSLSSLPEFRRERTERETTAQAVVSWRHLIKTHGTDRIGAADACLLLLVPSFSRCVWSLVPLEKTSFPPQCPLVALPVSLLLSLFYLLIESHNPDGHLNPSFAFSYLMAAIVSSLLMDGHHRRKRSTALSRTPASTFLV